MSNGVLEPRNTRSAGASGQNLTVNYTPANDGTNSTVAAAIDNNINERFEHGLIRFRMPDGGGSAEVTGGTLLQIDDSGPIDVYSVGVDIQASSTQTVTISIDQTGVEEGTPPLPARLRLGQNHPNPFNPRTSIPYALPASSLVQLVIFDTLGREIATLVDWRQPAGRPGNGFFCILSDRYPYCSIEVEGGARLFLPLLQAASRCAHRLPVRLSTWLKRGLSCHQRVGSRFMQPRS